MKKFSKSSYICVILSRKIAEVVFNRLLWLGIADQVKIRVGIDDQGRNCHMDFLTAIICSSKENDGKWSVNGD